MKKNVVIGIMVVVFGVLFLTMAHLQERIEAQEEYLALPGHTPYKVTTGITPEGERALKVIGSDGSVEYWTDNVKINLETGEVEQ